MELARTNAVFSSIALVSYFCAEIKILEKIWKNFRIYIFVEDPRSQKGSCGGQPQPPDATWPRLRAGRAWGPPGQVVARLVTPLSPIYLVRVKTSEPPIVLPKKIQSTAATSKPILGTRSSCSGTLSGWGLKGRSSPSPSPSPLHRPSMFPPSMCE